MINILVKKNNNLKILMINILVEKNNDKKI